MELWPPTSPTERDRGPSGGPLAKSPVQMHEERSTLANIPVQSHVERSAYEEKAKEKQEWKKTSLHRCNVLVNSSSEI